MAQAAGQHLLLPLYRPRPPRLPRLTGQLLGGATGSVTMFTLLELGEAPRLHERREPSQHDRSGDADGGVPEAEGRWRGLHSVWGGRGYGAAAGAGSAGGDFERRVGCRSASRYDFPDTSPLTLREQPSSASACLANVAQLWASLRFCFSPVCLRDLVTSSHSVLGVRHARLRKGVH